MDFWEVHSIFFIIFILIFPRLTILFATSISFGLFTLLGWIFCPYLLAAILGTYYYWDTNPILCILAWFVALGGTGGEVETVNRNKKKYYHG